MYLSTVRGGRTGGRLASNFLYENYAKTRSTMTVSRFISLPHDRDIFYTHVWERKNILYISSSREYSVLGVMHSLTCLSHKYFSLTKESSPRTGNCTYTFLYSSVKIKIQMPLCMRLVHNLTIFQAKRHFPTIKSPLMCSDLSKSSFIQRGTRDYRTLLFHRLVCCISLTWDIGWTNIFLTSLKISTNGSFKKISNDWWLQN